MADQGFLEVIKDQTKRSLWSLQNVIDCIPDSLWNRPYCETPLWKHVYHTLHSLDRWYINPVVYDEPTFHKAGLNYLNVPAEGFLSKDLLNQFAIQIENKINAYLDLLTEQDLAEKPTGSQFSRMQLIFAQHRHLDMHIGMMMGIVIAETDRWPKVLGLNDEIRARDVCEYD